MTIEKNHVVALQYTLNTVGENGEHSFVEKTETENPFTFLYGVGRMIPKFEEEIMGLSKGDKKAFTILPSEAYGERFEQAITQLPLEMFEQAGTPPVGAILPLQDQEGNMLNGIVLEVSSEVVTVDLNHPMAGRTLHFDVEILETRPATEEELAHGHAHGIDGNESH